MPTLAFAANIWPAATCKDATAAALRAGFRFVWSSALVHTPCQKAQREAIEASGIPRGELYIAGTVDSSGCGSEQACYTETREGALDQLQILGEPLDQLMLDYPPRRSTCAAIAGQWRAFAELKAAGKVRSIALSNFQLECLPKELPPPTVNQLRLYVGHLDEAALKDNTARGIVAQA